MVWWKRRRVDLGTYEHPPLVPLAPIERVVDEGVLISVSAVRMAIKNELIVLALRERRSYDEEAIALATRRRLADDARENDATADRLDLAHPVAPGAGDDLDDNEIARNEDHRRRPEVHRRLASALRDLADDPDAVGRLVDSARADAAQELSGAVVGRLRARDYGAEPGYAQLRAERLIGIGDDLAALATRVPSEG